MKSTTITVALFLFALIGFSQERTKAITEMKSLVKEVKKDEKEIVTNTNKINTLNSNIAKWSREKDDKLARAREALSNKIDEIENSQNWKNRRKTAQSGYKEYNPGRCNAGGPPPICSAGHWYYVGRSEAMAEYERYKNEVLNKLKNKISEIDQSYGKKIRDAQSEIDKLETRNNNLTYYLPRKRTNVSNAAYSWQHLTSKENQEKEKEWEEQVTKEEAYKQVLDHNLDEINNKLAYTNSEYLEAFTENHDKIRDKYHQQKDQLNDQKYDAERELQNHNFQSNLDANRLENDIIYARKDLQRLNNKWQNKTNLTPEEQKKYNQKRAQLESVVNQKESAYSQHVTNAREKSSQLQSSIHQYGNQLNNLEATYSESVSNLESQLKQSFANREQVLNQMKSQVQQQISSHRSLMKSNEILRKAEVDSWNHTKKAEIENIHSMCDDVGSYCGSVYSPLNYLPAADIDIIGDLFEGVPGGGVLEEFADKILKLPKGAIIPPTYKAGKTGTQSYFESKIGVKRFLNMKARFEDDPLNPDKGLDMKMCLEALGNSSCFGARRNKQTGNWETYSEGVFFENMKALNYDFDLEQYQKEINQNIKK